MNKLYLLLPFFKDNTDDTLSLLLKPIDFKDNEERFSFLKKIYNIIESFRYEDYEGIYDHEQFKPLIKSILNDKALEGNRPSPATILEAFEEWLDFHEDYYEKVTQKGTKEADENLKGYKDTETQVIDFNEKQVFLLYDSTEVKDTIFNAYLQNPNARPVALLDADANLYDNQECLQQQISGDKHLIPVTLIPLYCKALYQWFTEHREPERKFDENADKHRKTPRLNGYISPLTYTKEEIKPFLDKAIGTKDYRDKNLFFYDKNKNVYLYFWNENTPDQLFHAYEVSPKNMKEINKILSKGGRNLKNLIDKLGKE